MKFHDHALARMRERGASEQEVEMTVQEGERFAAKFDRAGFRRNFRFDGLWRGRSYSMKQIEAFAIWVVGQFENPDSFFQNSNEAGQGTD
jgi:hypothetical protein